MFSSYVADYGLTTSTRAYAFVSRKDRRVRTIGTIVIPPSSDDPTQWSETEAQCLSRLFERCPVAVTPAARGKVVFIHVGDDGTHKVFIYQVRGRHASLTACGNASAAAATVLTEMTGCKEVEFTLRASEREIKVTAAVNHNECGGALVEQQWLFDSNVECDEFQIANHKAASCPFLNPYILIEGALNLRPTELLESAGYALNDDLNFKYAVVTHRAIPFVRFFGCNGAHGAAPLSGIVTLALAAERVDWAKSTLYGGLFEHPMGVEILPAVTTDDKNHSLVSLPEIELSVYALVVA